MQNERRRIEASVMRAFWCVFGYAFVGIISLLYGITLQIYNHGADVMTMLFRTDDNFKQIYVVIIMVVIIFNLLFCHAYASLYIKETDIDKHLYPKLGHWLETILLVIILTYVIPLVFSCAKIYQVILTMLLISLPWCVSIVFYRTYLNFNEVRSVERHERLKYRLIIPAILLIATNIYVGSCVVEMLNGDIEYYIPFGILIFFVVMYCVIEYWGHKKKKESGLEKLMPYIYAGIVVLGELLILYRTHYWGESYFEIPARTLFLANFVAVYLAMFEGWFLLAKDMMIVAETENAGSINVKVKWGVEIILKGMPIVVFALFPIQRFQLLYIIFFSVGHMFAWVYWTYYESYTEEKIKMMPFMRGLFGTLTLVGLILDKRYPMEVEKYIGRVFGTTPIDSMITGIAAVSILVDIVAICIQYIKLEKEKLEVKQLIKKGIVWYIVVIFLLCTLYTKVQGMNQVRILVSLFGCLMFMIIELVIGTLKK